MRDRLGIIGVAVGVIGFSIYYCYAYFNYDPKLNPPLNQSIAALNYVAIMISMALLSLELYFSSSGNKKKLFGFNTVFWGGIGLAYLFRDVIHLIPSKLFIIITAGLWLIFGLMLYFLRPK